MAKIIYLREIILLMKNMTEKQVKQIEQRVIEACRNDSGHTSKLCAY